MLAPSVLSSVTLCADIKEVVNQSVQASESRMHMMAVAEVCWEDQAGASHLAPARIEDTSPSGVCIRINTPIAVGAKLTIRWQREIFSGVARNCRSDGVAFLMGIQRDAAAGHTQSGGSQNGNSFEQAATLASAELWWQDQNGTAHHAPARMESRVPSGTCLRLTTPIPVGSTLKVKWQKELFSGVASYCRWDGRTYLLGIQQDADRDSPVQARPAPDAPISEIPSLSPTNLRKRPSKQEANQDKTPVSSSPPEPAARLRQSFQLRSLSSLATEAASQVMPMIRRMIRSLPGPSRFDALNLKPRARHLVVKGKLCHQRAFFQNSGVSNRTTPL